jgi:serine O-acetyltransferase
MFDNLKHDTRWLRSIKKKPFPFYILESLLFENGYQAVVLHRIAHWFKKRGIPLAGPFFHRLSIFLTGVDISPAAHIGPGFRISHGVGLVIGAYARIGADCLLMHGVTLGAPTLDRIQDMPILGNNVVVGAGATIIGDLTVGDHVLIGVNTVVTQDVPTRMKVLPPREVEMVPRRQ